MNPSPMVRLLTGLSVVVPVPLLRSVGIARDQREYRLALGLRMFGWLGTVGFATLPFLLVPHALLLQWYGELAINGAFFLLMLACCVYMQRYCIRVGHDAITFRAFKTRAMRYQDIESTEVYVSDRGMPFLDIHFRDGRGRFRISGSVDHFNELVGHLQLMLRARRQDGGGFARTERGTELAAIPDKGHVALSSRRTDLGGGWRPSA
jgi:hypothetical protein